MNNMKFINKYLVALFLSFSVLACSNFGDMNENPNAPTQINNNPELLLTGICKDLVNNMVGDAWSDGNVMAQYAAKIVFTSFDQFEWGTNSGTWSNIYKSGREIQNLITIAETTQNDSYKAVGLILHAWSFQIATDMWGDIPYSQAMKGKTDEVFKPEYDKQAIIYADLLEKLDTANTLLAEATTAVKGDILFNGNLELWRKFGNSLRLRLLIRMSNASNAPVSVASEMKTILANPSQFPIMVGNSDNAVMTYTSTYPNVHPLSQASGHRIGSYDEYRMSETFETILKAYSDPRIGILFAPTENSVAAGTVEYSGMQNGMVDGSAYEYKGGPANLSKINPQRFYYSANSAQALLMLASEVQFIVAEAAVRYPEVAAIANAQAAYEKGIALNFEYWGATMPADFLTRTSSSAAYPVPVAFDNQIETILSQKWVSLFYVDFQGFIEYKRTGFPRIIKPGPDAQSDMYPSRYLYPDEEQALNIENYTAAVNSQAGSSTNYSYWTPVWWENK